jgi:hypothetical protein
MPMSRWKTTGETLVYSKLAVIEWLDACVEVDGTLPQCHIMKTAGWIIHRDKKTTLIASMLAPDGQRITTAIPTCLILKTKYFS